MAHVCPKSCSRLCTAAILIAVGVVQLIAGLILLKSKYVYLLSAPDFWTAVSNFAVGGMLGVSASVWKEIGKISPKHATRRNILASLMFSCLMINASTAAILILGEGNALLSIQLEVDSSSTLNSELLAYAYATSVCSPIVCIVISCVYMSGLCFRGRGKSMRVKTKKDLDEDDPYAYNWVFKSKVCDPPKPNPTILRRALSTKYLSSDEDSFSSSDSFHPYRSNSVPSVEGLDESLQRSIKRIRTRSDSNLFHQQPDPEVRTVGTEKRSLLRSGNRVSFIDESLDGGREMLLSLPQHSELHFANRSGQEGHGLVIENIPTEENYLVVRSSKCKSKDVPFNHSDFEDIRLCNENQSNRFSQRAPPLNQQFQTPYKPVARKSTITADVHMDARRLKSDYGYTNHNFSPEEPTLDYEADVSSRDILERNNGSVYADRRVRRTSTAKSLKSEAIDETRNGHRTAVRTCSAITSNTPDEFSAVDDWNYNETKFDQKKSSHDAVLQKMSFNKVSHSSMKRQPEEPKIDECMGIVDASFDTSPIDYLAGEVVPIQVSTLPRKLSSKLIPVTIPAVSGSRKYSLKVAETSGSKNFKNIPVNPKRGTSVVRTSKFDGNGEPKLLSFRGGIKAKEYRNRKPKNSGLPPNLPNTINHPEPSTSHSTEYRTKESSPSSPTHTSGYLSGPEDTRSAETSILSSATGQSPQERHWKTPTRASQDTWESSEMVKETMTRIIEESPEMHSKKELIDQLLSDPAFQRMVKQTLKETEI